MLTPSLLDFLAVGLVKTFLATLPCTAPALVSEVGRVPVANPFSAFWFAGSLGSLIRTKSPIAALTGATEAVGLRFDYLLMDSKFGKK